MRFIFSAFSALALATLPGCGASDGDIRIDSLRIEDTGAELLASISIHNGSSYSLFVYSGPRRLLWDDATKTLTLDMKESECSDKGSPLCTHYTFPAYVRIDSRDDDVVVVKLPRELTKLGGAAPGGGVSFEKQPIATAARVIANVAYADDPVDTAAPGQDPRAAVIAAERAVLVGEWRR